jgi:hypothetical protein
VAHYFAFFIFCVNSVVELAAETRVRRRGPDGNRKPLSIHLILNHHALPCQSSTPICATSYANRGEIGSGSVPMGVVSGGSCSNMMIRRHLV